MAHSVAKACSSSLYSSCGCDRSLTGKPSGDWEWRGCHSNVKFAGGLTKEFAATRVSKTGNAERKKMNRHNIRAGIKVGAFQCVTYSRRNSGKMFAHALGFVQAQYSEWTVGSLGSATCLPM